MGIVHFLLKRKLLVGLSMVLIFFIGLYATTQLDQELMPPITFDGASVYIDAGDMTTLDVEQLVTEPIEQVLQSIDGVKSFQSSTSVGTSSITIEMEEGLGEEITKEVELALNGLKPQLTGVDDIIVTPFSMNGTYEFYLDISQGNNDEMTEFARDVLEPRLESLPEVSDVLLVGMEEREILIELKMDKLNEFAVEPSQVISAIQNANSDLALGTLSDEEDEPTIRWNTSIHNVEDINAMRVPTMDGVKQISELASVTEQVTENSSGVWKNGSRDFILVQVARVSDHTQVQMAEAVRSEIALIKKEGLVSNFELNEIVAQADYVSDSIDGVTQNVLLGGILAIIILLLFLRNIRATIIVGLAIPISILLTFTAMWYFDYSFNMLSLIGLGLGIGMMVDASIVILESIYSKKENGMPNRKAVTTGVREVASAVLASMLTTIVVFLPIGLLGGEVGQFMIVLSVVIIITLVSSVVVSFTLIPTLAESFLKVRKKNKVQKEGKVLTKYVQFLQWMLRKKRARYSIILLFFVIFIGSLALITRVPMTVMPDVFNRYSEVAVVLESGVTPKEREEIAMQMNEQLATITDIKNTIIMDDVSSIYAIVNMTSAEDATMDQKEVNEQILSSLRELESAYPITSVNSAMSGGAGSPVSIVIQGEQLDKLTELSESMITELEKVDGLVGFSTSIEKKLKEERIILNEQNIDDDGLTTVQILSSIEHLFMKTQVTEITGDDLVTKNVVAVTDKESAKKEDVLANKILTQNGEEKELSEYISFEMIEAPTQIDHNDGERYVTVMADLEKIDLGTANREIEEVLNDFDVPSGYTISMGGDLEAQQDAMQEMMMILGIALFLVYVVMAVQFNSLVHPFIVMSIIPMTVTGVIIGLFLTQMELSIMSAMGIVMLIGIVLNNAILLLDRTKQLRLEGYSISDAIIDAGKTRMRPIFMTTLTTVGGMLPLAIATGVASNYQAPLAIVVISGLIFATFITLILIPAVYYLFEDLAIGLRRLFKRQKGKSNTIKIEG
ncbi:efflux RND transporter permease subunit [Bacillus suaedae]|uniref:Efflux RND transporter permease subunit n=1 Tax=Halalkalibacter suaedae TaxID=2822140 RepID=A0A941AN46_9BACI|nr:efflux RND transporter permease subunit [Bacillus suaedae]MBP3950501.1 efflux RND transporter permease subunit [Bacillus suaedae]